MQLSFCDLAPDRMIPLSFAPIVVFLPTMALFSMMHANKQHYQHYSYFKKRAAALI